MGSSYFGIPSMRNNGKSSSPSSSSSSRKNKKSSGSEKPKQPQRGLGVAQLEQIRLRTQMTCAINNNPPPIVQEEIMRVQGGVGGYGVIPIRGESSSSTSYPNYSQSSPSSIPTSTTYPHHPNYMMAFGEDNLRYHDSQPSTTLGWNPNSTGVLDNSTFRHSGMPSRPPPYFEDPRNQGMDLMRSSSQNSETSEHEEVDLELRLSI